jgi:hypothetical protein
MVHLFRGRDPLTLENRIANCSDRNGGVDPSSIEKCLTKHADRSALVPRRGANCAGPGTFVEEFSLTGVVG